MSAEQRDIVERLQMREDWYRSEVRASLGSMTAIADGDTADLLALAKAEIEALRTRQPSVDVEILNAVRHEGFVRVSLRIGGKQLMSEILTPDEADTLCAALAAEPEGERIEGFIFREEEGRHLGRYAFFDGNPADSEDGTRPAILILPRSEET